MQMRAKKRIQATSKWSVIRLAVASDPRCREVRGGYNRSMLSAYRIETKSTYQYPAVL